MSKEILAPVGTTNLTVYVQIRSRLNSMIWNGSAFEVYSSADIANYATLLSEEGAAGSYVGNFPTAIAQGSYGLVARQRVGGVVAESDPIVATGNLDWTGTAVGVPQYDPTTGLLNVNMEPVLDLVIEDGWSFQDVLKVIGSIVSAKCTGGGTSSVVFRNLGDTLNRVTATVDTNHNRLTLSFDLE